MKKIITIEVDSQEDVALILDALKICLPDINAAYSVQDKHPPQIRKDVTGMSEGISR